MRGSILEMIHSETATGALLQRIEQRTAIVGVIGLGHVGLPLAVEFARAGFRVMGFDIDKARVSALNKGLCEIDDVDNVVFQQALATKLRATDDFDRLAEVDAVTICVPTPLGKNKEPD